MARSRILPIPLILLIPIVLLAIVIIAGVYRFSLSDDEIMAKFPQAEVQSNPIVAEGRIRGQFKYQSKMPSLF